MQFLFELLLTLLSVDQIALPDFNAGAMENWGLVTYRETALLYDPIESSTGNKERVTTVISHELAHMVGCNASSKCLFSRLSWFYYSGEKNKTKHISQSKVGHRNVISNLERVLSLPHASTDRSPSGDKLTLLTFFRCI